MRKNSQSEFPQSVVCSPVRQFVPLQGFITRRPPLGFWGQGPSICEFTRNLGDLPELKGN